MSGNSRVFDNLLQLLSSAPGRLRVARAALSAAVWAILTLPLAACASVGKVQVAEHGLPAALPSELVAPPPCAAIAGAIRMPDSAAPGQPASGSAELSCAIRPRQVGFAHDGALAEARVDSVRWAMLSEARLTVFDRNGGVTGSVWAGVGHASALSDAESLAVARKLGEAISARLNSAIGAP